MKALTLTQPWATLVAIGMKQIETRSWTINYRGPLAIHAAKGFPKYARDICNSSIFADALETHGIGHPKDLPLGAIIATCELVHIKQMDEVIVFPGCKSYAYNGHEWLFSKEEKAFGEYSVGRYMWLLENIIALPSPIPAKGALSLWEWGWEGGHVMEAGNGT
jgi:hypothetical protein